MTLEHLGDKKVLLVCGDMMSQKIGTRDRASRPIIGDAVTISVVENCENGREVYCCLKNEGENGFWRMTTSRGTAMFIAISHSFFQQRGIAFFRN